MGKTAPKIALEEHFMMPDLIEHFRRTSANISPALFDKALGALQDFGERRLSAMDSIGVEKSVLSISGPGVQAELNTAAAVRLARKANDFLAERIAGNPTRYAGFAHLALQEPSSAADELERSVKDLK